jgi:hypothetical protein
VGPLTRHPGLQCDGRMLSTNGAEVDNILVQVGYNPGCQIRDTSYLEDYIFTGCTALFMLLQCKIYLATERRLVFAFVGAVKRRLVLL